MSSPQRTGSSGSDGATATVDERKRKRMESNRESARRSRMRKQKQAQDSTDQVNQLQSSNQQLLAKINSTTQKFVEVESSNNVLRAQIMELTDRLRSLNSVLQIVEEVSGLTLDIPEIQPWQQNHYPMHPIMTSADMFYS